MRRVLHLIRDPADRTALDVVSHHSRDPEVSLAVVLLPGAGQTSEPLPGRVYRLDGDGASGYPAIDHERLLALIFEADTVVSW